MDDRIFLIPKREHPPTTKANEARSTRKLVARISKKLALRSTRRLVAVTLVTEFKVCSNRKEIVKKTDSTVRDAPELGLVNRGFEQDSRVQSVQRKVDGVDHQYG